MARVFLLEPDHGVRALLGEVVGTIGHIAHPLAAGGGTYDDVHGSLLIVEPADPDSCDTAVEVSRAHPQCGVVCVSIERQPTRGPLSGRCQAFVRKPFSTLHLARVVEGIIGLGDGCARSVQPGSDGKAGHP